MEKTNHIITRRRIPIDAIKLCVSIASEISIEELEMTSKTPFARKKERKDARNLSMKLSRDYSNKSLAVIGMNHGLRDHATALHADKVVNELLSTKDKDMIDLYNKSIVVLRDWVKQSYPTLSKSNTESPNPAILKMWIKNKVPLYVRYRILNPIRKKCSVCGTVIDKPKYYGNRTKTLPTRL